MLLTKDGQQEACCDGGADNTGHVGAHSVHEQEVGGVSLLAFQVGNTGCHGNSGNTCGTNQRIDLAAGQLAHHQTAQQTAASGQDECANTQNNDLQSLSSQEGGANHGCTNSGGQQDGSGTAPP